MNTNFNKILNGFWKMGEFKTRFKKFLFLLGKDAFLFILFILLVEIIFAELLFYSYVLSVEIKEPSLSQGFIGFKEKEYQDILKEWQNRENTLKDDVSDNLSNPFQP